MRLLSFFFNDTAPTEIYPLPLHDALPICQTALVCVCAKTTAFINCWRINHQSVCLCRTAIIGKRSEEHTSELQSRQYLVCRLLLEKKIKITINHRTYIHSYMITLYDSCLQ